MKRFLTILFLMVPVALLHAATYIMATNGNDSNAGTLSAPFATSAHFWALPPNPGDTLYVRGNGALYYQRFLGTVSGSPGKFITVATYPGDTPAIIDGGKTNAQGAEMVNASSVTGDFIMFSNLVVRNSLGSGVILQGSNDVATGILSISNELDGIRITGKGGSVVTNCQVTQCSQTNWNFTNTVYSDVLSINHDIYGGLIINCQCWNNWGDGLTTYLSQGAMLVGNSVWDNLLNCYLSDCTNALFEGNLVYSTPGNLFAAGNNQTGLLCADEVGISRNRTVINNVFYGNKQNIYWGKGVLNTGGFVNDIICFNTLADIPTNTGGFGNFALGTGMINNGTTVIQCNLITQTNNSALITSGPAQATITNVVMGTNLWSSAPSVLYGSGDITNSAQLRWNCPPVSGYYVAWWAIPLFNSPALGAGNPCTNYLGVDYFGSKRNAVPSVGAIELALVQPTSTQILTNAPAQ